MNRLGLGWLHSLLLLAMVGGFSVHGNAETEISLDWHSPLFADHPLVGTIHTNQSAISSEELVQRMAGASHILIGEKHDNPDHQQLELFLLEALSNQARKDGKTIAVVFEMLDNSQQENIDSMVKALAENEDLKLSAEQIQTDLEWPEQGWRWEDYADVISWALNNRVPLLAGNIDSGQIKSVYEKGIDAEFTSATALRDELEQPLLEQVYHGHCELMEKASLSPMVDVQLVKDAAMANALLKADTDKSVLIAGTGHTRIDSAIPKHLRLDSRDPVLSVALVEVDPDLLSATDYEMAERFDVLIFTPVANQRDYCVELKKSMSKH